MRAVSSAISVASHIAIAAAALIGSTTTGRSDAARSEPPQIVLWPVERPPRVDGVGAAAPTHGAPIRISPPDWENIPISGAPQTGALLESLTPAFSASEGLPDPEAGVGWNPWRTEESAEILSGPIPVYPDLLRQARVQGRVVLEAVVDTTGRVLPQSIFVVLATNPGFVASAKQALLATLFRPAMSGAGPVRLRVRIPYEFTIRSGIGRAR